MKLFLYKTLSPNNSINKLLEAGLEVEVKLKDNTSISTPSILLYLENTQINNYNFCYIPTFKRYYFIDNISIQRQNLFVLDLKVDVLESYKEDILKSKAYITQSTSINPYFNEDYDVLIKKECDVYKSSKSNALTNNTIILVTVGGL